MSLWKQLLLTVVVLAIAAGLWARFFPGAPDVLTRWGLDWAVVAVSNQNAAPGGQGNEARRGPGLAGGTPMVIVADIATATINDRLTAIGTGQALSSVTVTPFSAGRLVELLVDAGSRVAAGTVIARLDSDMEEIGRDRAAIALADARARLDRVTSLRSSNAATAVQVNEAQLAVSNAELELRNAELALDRRSIVAPISGVVGILPVSVGNAVTTTTEIATIDDRSQIVIDFWVPERFASMIMVGQSVGATSVARASERFNGTVSAVDNRVDAASRTLRVQARIANESDVLRAGMSFQVSMSFPGDTYPAVDPLAIQWGTDGAFVWVIEGERARRAFVRIVQRNTDSVLITGDLGAAQAVVTEGIHAVREGLDLRVVRRGPAGEEPWAPQASASAAGT